MGKWRILGIGAALIGGLLCIYVARYDLTSDRNEVFESALRRQNRMAAAALQQALTRVRPIALWQDGRWLSLDARFRSIGLEIVTTQALFRSGWQVVTINEKHFLFTSFLQKNQRIIRVFAADDILAGAVLNGAFASWVVNSEGQIILHSSSRFVGKDAINIRPVALAMEGLRGKKNREASDTYASLEAENTTGVWSTLPMLGMAVVTEWPGQPYKRAENQTYTILLCLGLLLIIWAAYAIVLSAKSSNAESKTSVARAFPAPIAMENLAHNVLERFLHRAWQLATGKQVWQLVTDALSELYGRAPTLYFRYSPTSCSLVPEYASGIESLASDEQEYLLDTRLYVGAFPQKEDLEISQAFQSWEADRSRISPLSGPRWRMLRVHSLLHSGFWFIAVPDQVSEQEDRVAQIILEAGANLYEGKQRLLQLSHARPTARENLANSPNQLSH